ncbi:MAG: arginine--tRNA ligase, partial [Ignavibacteria bacterium]
MDIKQYVADKLKNVLNSLGVQETNIILERPKDNTHGDISTNAAMMYGKKLGKNPKEFAENIIASLNIPDEYIIKASVAGPGFINLFIADKYYSTKLQDIIELKGNFGRMNDNAGKTADIEWVSANPTGELHTGHGRGTALGKAIANLLEWTG